MHFAKLNVFAAVAVTTILSVACSTSQFTGGKSGNNASSNSGKATDGGSAAEKSGSGDANAAGAGSGKSDSAFNNAQFSAVSAEDQKAVGCTLPDNVAKLMAGSVSANLTGWGAGASAVTSTLQNLDLNSCKWFQQAKAAGIARYMITFTDSTKKQSYAQPYTGAANPVAFAACLAQGAAVSSIAGGPITCQFMPF